MRILFFTLFLLVFSACRPSMNTIYQYQATQRLQNSVVIVELEKKWEDAALLEKYGKAKKAKQLADRSFKRNRTICETFENHFDFTDVVYCYDLDLSLDSGKFYDHNLEVIDLDYPIEASFLVEIYVDYVDVGENSREYLFADLAPLAQDRNTSISVKSSGNWSKLNLRGLVSALNYKVKRIYKRSEKAKERLL